MSLFPPRCLHLPVLALLLAACALWTPAAQAATSCSATSTSVAFGTVSTSGTTDVAATFNVTCTSNAFLSNVKVRMCLNIGDGNSGGGNFNPRRMLNGFSDALQFQLYTDPARSQIWGALGNPTVPNPAGQDFDFNAGFGGSQTVPVTIYGRVPTQTLIAGNYSNPFTGAQTSINYQYNEAFFATAPYPASCTSGGAGGATVNNAFPFTATATVAPNCRAYTTTDLDFGSVAGVITGNLDQTSSIGMICTGRTAWQVGLDNGLHAAGTTRRMQLGATPNYVTYELYRNAARSLRWGNTLNTDTVQGTGTGSAQTLTVYGRVPATQTPAAGAYGDTITVTITY